MKWLNFQMGFEQVSCGTLHVAFYVRCAALSQKREVSKHDFRRQYLCETSGQRTHRWLFLMISVNPVVLEFSRNTENLTCCIFGGYYCSKLQKILENSPCGCRCCLAWAFSPLKKGTTPWKHFVGHQNFKNLKS